MRTETDPGLTIPLAAMLPLVAAMVLVAVRGEVDPEVTALVLALTVVAGGRLGGRAGGVASGLMAAVGFDFFHTEPYLSLKVTDTKDIATAVLLLCVGLAVGGVAGRAERAQGLVRARRRDSTGLTRVLAVAAGGCAEDVVLAVRAELLGLLDLQDCWFTTEAVHLTTIDHSGTIRRNETVSLAGDLALPVDGVALPVTWNDRCFGYLAAAPVPGAIVSAESRRVAVAMAEVLGLALAAEPAAA